MLEPNEPRMRLLFVVSSMEVGGPQKSLLGLLERLDTRRYEVSLLVLDPFKNSLLPFVARQVALIETPDVITAATLPKGRMVWALRCLLSHLIREGHPRLALSMPLMLVRAALAREAGQRVRQRVWACIGHALPKVDGAFQAAVGILGLSTYAVVDLVAADHKYHWVRSDSRILGRDESIEARYFAELDGALSVSTTCEDVFVEMYPQMIGRTRVYKNDIPTTLAPTLVQWPSAGAGSTKVLTVNRLDPLKGLDLAIAACALLTARGVDVSWLVLGDGPERRALEERVAAVRQVGRFTFGGTVFDTTPFLDQADVYVHPSRTEGRSNAVEEARARGKAILATRYATVGDQIADGTDGLVCDLDSVSLADAIERLAGDPRLRSDLGAAAAAAYADERDDPNWLFEHLVDGVVPQGSS